MIKKFLDYHLQKIRDFIDNVNITNFKIIAVVGLLYLTGLKVLFLQGFGPRLEGETLGIWCGCLTAMAGVATWQYRIKRHTAEEMPQGVAEPPEEEDPPAEHSVE